MTATAERSPRPARSPAQGKTVRVDRDRYCQLLISRKNLERWDSPDGRLRGLVDVETGVLYVIEVEKL